MTSDRDDVLEHGPRLSLGAQVWDGNHSHLGLPLSDILLDSDYIYPPRASCHWPPPATLPKLTANYHPRQMSQPTLHPNQNSYRCQNTYGRITPHGYQHFYWVVRWTPYVYCTSLLCGKALGKTSKRDMQQISEMEISNPLVPQPGLCQDPQWENTKICELNILLRI